MKILEDNSVDAIITDPPYGLKFMNKGWDYEVPKEEMWREALRVLKPGGHLLSFGGTRTYHRLVVAIEDAGFEIRDQIQWLYGSGFPKSHNLKDDHKGWGTALKPANEPICLARKPLSESTVAKNLALWGCGAINIDASRIGTEQVESGRAGRKVQTGFCTPAISNEKQYSQGRWPANIILDKTAAKMLDEQSGNIRSRHGNEERGFTNGGTGSSWMFDENKKGTGKKVVDLSQNGYLGGASRFFYVAKASKRERNAGLEGMPEQNFEANIGSTKNQLKRIENGSVTGERNNSPQANFHPTVKPIKLMEYLIRLITPPNGTVLDPFMGSGSTGVAAKQLGFKFIGIEMNEEYVEIAKRRINDR